MPRGERQRVSNAIAAAIAAAIALTSGAATLAQQAAPAPGLTQPGQHARANGVKTCLPLIEGVSRQFIAGVPTNAQSVWAVHEPDKRLFMSAIAADAAPVIGFVTAAPHGAGACDSALVTVSYSAEGCQGLVERGRAELRPTWQTHTVAAFAHVSGGAVYLIPAGAGCLVVRQEVRFIDTAAQAKSGAAAPVK